MEEQRNRMVKQIIDNLSDQYSSIVTNFESMLPIIRGYIGCEISMNTQHILQNLLNTFLHDNNLDIRVNVHVYEDKIIFIGATLNDELVWQSIQNRQILFDLSK